VTLFSWEDNHDFSIGNYPLKIGDKECYIPQDFSTPFGNILYPPPDPTCPFLVTENGGLQFDFSPEQTGFFVNVVDYRDIFGNVLAKVEIGPGFIVNIGVGSTSIKADWQAMGNASGSGQDINYSTNGGNIEIGPVMARDFGSTQDASIRLTNFRYYPSLFFRLDGYLCVRGEILGNKKNCDDINTRNNPIKIYEVDYQPDVEPLHIHPGTQDSVVLNIPVTSPIHIEKIASKPVATIGDTVIITNTIKNIGQTDLTQVQISDNGENILDCSAILGTCIYVRTLIATTDDDLASVTEVTATLVREDKEVQVRSTQTKFIPVLNGVVGNGTRASCNEAALDAELGDYSNETIIFNCGGPTTIVIGTTKSISRNLTINGGGDITLSGGNQARVFRVETGANLTLQNLTVANGRVHRPSDSTGTIEAGGGLFNLGTVNLQNVILSSNEADQGGGIHNSGNLYITDHSKLSGNTATIKDGGAIYNDGALALADSTIGGNKAAGGGGILNWGSGQVEISKSIIANNQAVNGGGIENGENGVVIIRDTQILTNYATIGGGIFNFESGRMIINNSQINGNIAAQAGGIQNKGLLGIQVDLNNANAILPGTTLLSNNQAVSSEEAAALDGGAIYNDGILKIAHTTIKSNSARGGGGIINWGGGTLDITDTTIADNQAGNGGGVENGGSGVVTIANTQIHNNEAISIGGGIVNYETGRLIISNSNVGGNIATQGGGVYNKGLLGIQIDLSNNDTTLPGASIFSGNTAITNGGAVFSEGMLKIGANTTFSANEAKSGGGGLVNTGAGVVGTYSLHIDKRLSIKWLSKQPHRA
ncbi:MAG: hypothetical protein U0401_35945, partial [Anaerolineae bacterium]